MAVAAAAAAAPRKDHKTAVCIVPPEHLWGPIQAIREIHDKHFKRWMPHINLLYPFWEDRGANLETAAELAAAACATVEPFEVSLPRFKFFNHGRSCTMWLDPCEDGATPGQPGQLAALQAALEGAFPGCDDLSAVVSDSFRPHLSIGQWPSERAVQEAAERLGATWQPVRFTIDRVFIISRADFHDPFHKRFSISLGRSRGGTPPVQPLGTTGTRAPPESVREEAQPQRSPGAWQRSRPAPPAAQGTLDRFLGREAAASGPGPRSPPSNTSPPKGRRPPARAAGEPGAGAIWNFAYGANMNRHKLEVERNISPLESVAGRLHGHRLTFTHRGGFGNVELAPGECVHGVLHLLSPADFDKLAANESQYERREVEVEAYDGRGLVTALVFYTPDAFRIRPGRPPTSRYLKLLQTGAASWRLDPEYVRWLNSLPSVEGHKRGPEYWRGGGPAAGGRKREAHRSSAHPSGDGGGVTFPQTP